MGRDWGQWRMTLGPPLSQSHNGLWPLDVSPRADREGDRGGRGVIEGEGV